MEFFPASGERNVLTRRLRCASAEGPSIQTIL
jgi:hypothetical protein